MAFCANVGEPLDINLVRTVSVSTAEDKWHAKKEQKFTTSAQ
jgi:hypothetical protein